MTVNCDADYDYIGTEFFLLFMENELQDMELELQYTEQNDQTLRVVVQSPYHLNSQLPSVLTINPGGK